MKAADKRRMTAVAMTEPRQLVRGIAAVAQKHELSFGKPVNQRCHQLKGQIGCSFVPSAFGLVEFLGVVQRCQHRQGPAARSEGELHRKSQHDPAVSPSPDHVAVAGANGVVMASFDVDFFAAVLGRGVVHRNQHGLVGRNVAQDGGDKNLSQRPQRPDRVRKDTVVSAGMATDHAAHRPQHSGDCPPPHCEDGPDAQGDNPLESWACKCYRKLHEKRLRRRWKRKHTLTPFRFADFGHQQDRQESVFCASDSSFISLQKRQKSS